MVFEIDLSGRRGRRGKFESVRGTAPVEVRAFAVHVSATRIDQNLAYKNKNCALVSGRDPNGFQLSGSGGGTFARCTMQPTIPVGCGLRDATNGSAVVCLMLCSSPAS